MAGFTDAARAHLAGTENVLPSLVYLDILDGLTLADLTYLLDPVAPPRFAAQLTHLALKVHLRDRAAAAALLPSLSSTYKSLTHVCVGVQSDTRSERLDECPAWHEAVERVTGVVGSFWCASVDDVVAWREDVIWRRGAGVPEKQWFVSNK